jgi:hypothetical protein
MHDFLIGLTFLAMVLAPAMVASYSGKLEAKAE